MTHLSIIYCMGYPPAYRQGKHAGDHLVHFFFGFFLVISKTFKSSIASDIKRTPSEYRTAFITNVACITASMFISYLMCVRELFHHSFNYLNRHKWRRTVSEKFFLFIKFMIGGICLFPIGPILAPFFILYIGKYLLV